LTQDIAFLIVGDGTMKSEIQSCCFDFPNRLFFTGHLNDVSPLYELADLLVLPSLSEGLPMVVIEAFAHGLPVLANNVGGVSEIVVDGYNGILCDAWDTASAYQKMSDLLNNNNIRREFSENAKKTIDDKFTVSLMVNKTYMIYQTLLTK
jgi:glycosyltransferase involved in cell wall biosynthesis